MGELKEVVHIIVMENYMRSTFLQEYQGMKIGQKLFQALLSECIKNDMQSLLVWVVTNNPSKTFL